MLLQLTYREDAHAHHANLNLLMKRNRRVSVQGDGIPQKLLPVYVPFGGIRLALDESSCCIGSIYLKDLVVRD